MDKPISIKKTYLTGPYSFNIFLKNVFARKIGKTKRYKTVTINPIDSLIITLDGKG